MSVRRIGLVHPPADGFPSGGDLYDRQILRQAQSGGFPLEGMPWRDDAVPGKSWDLLVWDSLLLDRVQRFGHERLGLLLHYLPSLQPGLDSLQRTALRATEQRALGQADFAIATGMPVADAIRARAPAAPVFLCEPGVADVFRRSRAFPPPRPAPAHRAPRLLTVAHLLPAKGHGPLLEILRALRELPWHWHVAGDGGRSPEVATALREQSARAGLEGRITWHGGVGEDAVAALMADSDLFVFPSLFEAYGTVLAEAAAAGLPVLANRVGAADQLVRCGVTGYLVGAGDWAGFGRRLRELLVDADLRAALRENLRDRPVRGWDEAFADFWAACEAVPGRGRPTG